jgi:hypothetical protein
VKWIQSFSEFFVNDADYKIFYQEQQWVVANWKSKSGIRHTVPYLDWTLLSTHITWMNELKFSAAACDSFALANLSGAKAIHFCWIKVFVSILGNKFHSTHIVMEFIWEFETSWPVCTVWSLEEIFLIIQPMQSNGLCVLFRALRKSLLIIHPMQSKNNFWLCCVQTRTVLLSLSNLHSTRLHNKQDKTWHPQAGI